MSHVGVNSPLPMHIAIYLSSTTHLFQTLKYYLIRADSTMTIQKKKNAGKSC